MAQKGIEALREEVSRLVDIANGLVGDKVVLTGDELEVNVLINEARSRLLEAIGILLEG